MVKNELIRAKTQTKKLLLFKMVKNKLQAKSPKNETWSFFAHALGDIFQNVGSVKKQVDHDDPAGYQEDGAVAEVGGNC